jgi:ATP-dependent Clp protease protease subunit
MELDELIELIEIISNGEIEKANEISFSNVLDLTSAMNREIFIGTIVPGLGKDVDQVIRFWNNYDNAKEIPVECREPIKIYIDSLGGDLIETFTMIDSISMSKTPVWTICTGAAYSGGFFTFIAGHKRFAYPLSSFLYHEGSTGTSGDASKFRNFAAFYEKQMKQLKEVVLKYTTIDEDTYEKHIKDDWWFTAEEALEYGICDEISKELI